MILIEIINMREWQKVPSTCNGYALDSKEGEPAVVMKKAR